jgi:GlpG protein
MRQIGTVADEKEAKALADYLLTLEITTRVDRSAKGGFVVWARREEQVDRARREYEEFVKNPADPKYQGVEQTAREIRKKAERAERQHAKNTVDLRGRWAYRPPERCVVVLLLVAASVAVGVASNLGQRLEPLYPLFLASSRPTEIPGEIDPDDPDQVVRVAQGHRVGAEGLKGLRRGEVWRLVTPIFIHFGPIHLMFNMFVLYDLGGLIEIRKGHLRLLLLVLVGAVVSNLAQYTYEHTAYFGGMSGVNYALFGYVWMRGKFAPEEGMILRPDTISIMIIWLFVCLTGAVGPIANTAHFVGLGVGVLFGVLPNWRDALRRLA